MVRTVEEWIEILGPLMDADPSLVARRVLGDLIHYRENGAYRDDDVNQLANALVAYQSLSQ